MDLNKFTDQELFDRWTEAVRHEQDLREAIFSRGFTVLYKSTNRPIPKVASPRNLFYATKSETKVTRLA